MGGVVTIMEMKLARYGLGGQASKMLKEIESVLPGHHGWWAANVLLVHNACVQLHQMGTTAVLLCCTLQVA